MMSIDETGRDHQTGGVQGLSAGDLTCRNGGDPSGADSHVANAVELAFGIYHSTVENHDIEVVSGGGRVELTVAFGDLSFGGLLGGDRAARDQDYCKQH